MSYLLDRRNKRKKWGIIAILVVVIFVLVYFKNPVFSSLSYVSHIVTRPVFAVGNMFGGKFFTFTSYFSFKSSLYAENENLKAQLLEQSATLANRGSLLEENIKLKEELGRPPEARENILGAILSKPNRSAYDTLLIDIGTDKNIKVGSMVFALGGVPIGKVSEVSLYSSTVVLFSSSGEKTEGVISSQPLNEEQLGVNSGNIFLQAVGRGGGNFEMILPRDFTLNKGDEVVLPGITPYTFAVVDSVISDPRDSFLKALLISPVNIQNIKFVQVELQ